MAHPNSGFYIEDNKEYVSVSTVLGETSEMFDPSKAKGLEFWRRNEPDWEDIVQRAQRRGKIIHAEIEGTILGIGTSGHEDEATYEEIVRHNIQEYIHYLSPLLTQIIKENSEGGKLKKNLELEGVLFCPQGYAGTADARFTWANEYTIWDWKTVRSYKEYEDEAKGKKAKPASKYKEAFLQLGAYALAHNINAKAGKFDSMITQGVICVCYDWREPQLHILDRTKLKTAVLGFVERFNAYCEMKNTAFPRSIEEAAAETLNI
jgi:hypothetical protein